MWCAGAGILAYNAWAGGGFVKWTEDMGLLARAGVRVTVRVCVWVGGATGDGGGKGADGSVLANSTTIGGNERSQSGMKQYTALKTGGREVLGKNEKQRHEPLKCGRHRHDWAVLLVCLSVCLFLFLIPWGATET